MMKACLTYTSLLITSLLLSGCGFQLSSTGIGDSFDGYQVSAPASSKISKSLKRELGDHGLTSSGARQVNFQILRESFSAGRSLASKAATPVELQLNLAVEAMITLPGEAPVRVEYKLHDFYPINFRDPHGIRALRRGLEDRLAEQAAGLLIESVNNRLAN
ncbi:MAG: hypothetical protein OXF72_00230 [Gammaproteobacteria bacterium]|nr:hypothetical protein [Gammaproteobacteria bacterium]